MNKQLKSLLLQRKGLTLMEVLIVMSLIGIVSVPLIQLLLSGQKQFVTHQNILNEKSRCMLLQEKIKDEVLLAKSVRLLQGSVQLRPEDIEPLLKQGETAIYLIQKDSGYYELVKESKETTNSSSMQVLLNEDYLKTNHLALNFKLEDYDQKALEVTISEENYRTDTAFQLLNLKQSENSEEMQGQILIYTK